MKGCQDQDGASGIGVKGCQGQKGASGIAAADA